MNGMFGTEPRGKWPGRWPLVFGKQPPSPMGWAMQTGGPLARCCALPLIYYSVSRLSQEATRLIDNRNGRPELVESCYDGGSDAIGSWTLQRPNTHLVPPEDRLCFLAVRC